MDEFIQQLFDDSWGRLVLRHLAGGGLSSAFQFVLVAARLSGVLLVAPCFLQSVMPVYVRSGLVIFLSLIVTSALGHRPNHDDALTLVAYESFVSGQVPVLESVCLMINELALGTLLGVGVITVLSGLRMGSDWLDRQTGLGIGSLMSPDAFPDQADGRSLAQIMGCAVFLTLKPVGGLILLLQSLLQTFQDIPVGSTSWWASIGEAIGAVVQQSFVLGLRIAIPLVGAMTLIDLALAFIGRDTALPFGPVSLAIRTSLSMIILALTLTMLPEVMTTASLSLLQSLRGVR